MFKIDFRDQKWPENGLKGVLKWFKTQNWQLNQFSANFEKNEKIDFFWKKKKFMISGRISIFRPNFDRKSAGNPFIPPYLLPKTKKWSTIARSTSDFPLKNVLGLHFGQNKVYYLRSLKSLN